MSRYRFATRPWWILSHVFVALCVLGFVRLGIWQLERLDERRASNEVIAARVESPPAPFESFVPKSSEGSFADKLSRRVTVNGTYRVNDQVLIRNRSDNGAPGFWVITPMQTNDGRSVLVNRGWIPFGNADGGPPSAYAPPAGEVVVTGLLRVSQLQEGVGVSDPADGHLDVMSRVDVGRVARQMDGPVAPAYVDLIDQRPAQSGAYPKPVPPPDLSEGSHLSYALQWFTFAILTTVVYGLILRRKALKLAEPPTEDLVSPGASV